MKNQRKENTKKDIAMEVRCTICNKYGFAVVGNNGKVIGRLCGSCFENVYGTIKPNHQTKLLL